MMQNDRLVRMVRDPKFLMLVLLVVLNVVFSLASPSYMSLENMLNMLKQTAMGIMVASASTILMMTGNFDLSAGSNLALTGVVYTLLLTGGMPLLPAALIALACGIAVGVVNGTLVAKVDFPPFIATLGMMYIARGLALILAGGTPVRGEKVPLAITSLARGYWLGIPIPVYFLVIDANSASHCGMTTDQSNCPAFSRERMPCITWLRRWAWNWWSSHRSARSQPT